MKRRVYSLFAMAALLAVPALSAAQNDDHRSHGEHRSRSRAERGDRRQPSDHRSSSEDRSDRGRGDDRPPSSDDRRNPFNRDDRGRPSGYDRGGDAPRPREHTVLGAPIHGEHRSPSYYDGRGYSEPVRYGKPPVHEALGISIRQSEGYRGTEVAFGGQIGGLRVGFVSYSGGGYRRTGYREGEPFGYRYYAYDPFAPDVVVVASPWYRYSYLPPYIDHTHVIIERDYPGAWDWDGWRTYDSERRDEAIQNSLDDLRDAFEDGSTRIADRLVPQEGNVAIFNDGRYDYSLNPDDFQKMFLDGVEQSKTVRYEILETRTRGDEVRIRARHEYKDSWGETQSVIHRITLRREGGGDYVIREFGTE